MVIKNNKQSYPVQHEYVSTRFADFIMLPLGHSMNKMIANSRPGDYIEFVGGERCPIVAVDRMNVRSAACNGLSYMKYGRGISRILEQWRVNSIFLGSGNNAVDTEECLVVFYGKRESKI